jgi:hypothetical protein
MRISIRCTQEGCDAVFDGNGDEVMKNYAAHLERHMAIDRELDLAKLKIVLKASPKKYNHPQKLNGRGRPDNSRTKSKLGANPTPSPRRRISKHKTGRGVGKVRGEAEKPKLQCV